MKAIKEIVGKALIYISIITACVLVNSELCAQDQGQDTVYLKDGSIIKGTVEEVVPGEKTKIRTNDGSLLVFQSDEVERIKKEGVEKNNKDKEDAKELSGWTGNANYLIGQVYTDGDDWYRVVAEDMEGKDVFPEWGVSFDFRKKEWPLGLILRVLKAKENNSYNGDLYPVFKGTEVVADITETHIGVRKEWTFFQERLHPFLGAGVAFITGQGIIRPPSSSGFDELTEDDDTHGFWVDCGAYWVLFNHVNIGANLIYSKAEIEIADEKIDAGGFHTLVFAGFHW